MTDSTTGHAAVQRSGRPARGRSGRPLAGLVLLVVGLAFLLDNLDLVESWSILRFWPVILLGAGIKHLVDARHRGSTFTGVLLVAAGALLLLDALELIDASLGDLWPLILVAIGLRLLLGAVSNRAGASEVSESEESATAFLGSVERRNGSADYRGGSVSAFMGGVNLDLREADIAGERAVLDVLAFMGGVELRIPEAWTVDVGTTSIMGGVEDKTRGAAGGKRLVLTGTVIMGGIDIRN